jgi:predicted DCC family thiol-disulfide oxidoreductase YuxK
MLTAIYDGKCVLCNQSRRMVRLLDWGKRIEFADLHQADTRARFPHVDYALAMGAMHLLAPDGQTLYDGFPAVRRMLRELPLGLPVWALLHLPGMNWLGPRVYAWVAEHRYKINKAVGGPQCDENMCRLPQRRS